LGTESPAATRYPIRREPWLKRPFDVTVALIALILVSPLWLLIAIAIKTTGSGPILFRQQRWGKGGEFFWINKFRTMDHGDEETVVQAGLSDRRVTTVGRILRRTGMDEIPQFVNILRGDMSFVGPRALAVSEVVLVAPGRPIFYEELPGFSKRLAVRPGLTGTATIFLPRDAHPDEKFKADLEYIEQQSFLFDLKLVLMSLWISIRGRWETRESKL
jgi:lipopolysaccharide/colanic/teichoic acid biosynthesis glycosyltransferase